MDQAAVRFVIRLFDIDSHSDFVIRHRRTSRTANAEKLVPNPNGTYLSVSDYGEMTHYQKKRHLCHSSRLVSFGAALQRSPFLSGGGRPVDGLPYRQKSATLLAQYQSRLPHSQAVAGEALSNPGPKGWQVARAKCAGSLQPALFLIERDNSRSYYFNQSQDSRMAINTFRALEMPCPGKPGPGVRISPYLR